MAFPGANLSLRSRIFLKISEPEKVLICILWAANRMLAREAPVLSDRGLSAQVCLLGVLLLLNSALTAACGLAIPDARGGPRS